MKKKIILKEAGVLLIAVAMVLSTVAVTADTKDDIRNRQTCVADSFEEVGYTSIESDPSSYLPNTGGPVIFSQLPIPDDSTGFGPYSDAGSGGPWRAYDNFWGLTEVITDVHWWGLWTGVSGQPTAGDVFEISFCADNGGIPDYNNHIVDFTGSLGTEITYVSTGNFYWGWECYYMEMDLPAPVSMASGWISFYKTTINAQTFAWLDSPTGDNNAYQKNFGSFLFDWAFELTGGSAELEIGNITGGLGASSSVKNVGPVEAENVVWEIDFEGGIILSPTGGSTTGGPVNIPATTDLPITALAIGFGGYIIPLNIVVSADADNADPVSKTVPAKLLLFVVII
ncbi:hypothetical protein MBGDF03_00850 [Thermoplasmatales archaeon SCGC AB-540-F20]|nr:hypothetical protein MBGDF03_00850 [Thermoplasmatales archaeon SCGC AB-540-F20]